jgi:hypothetical protein
VDFSLGMGSMGLNDPSGDVLEDRENEARNRATIVRFTSPSPHGGDRNESGSRVSHDSGRSTSIQRVGTNSSLGAKQSTHRNRFFSRNRSTADEEIGMANIPEADYDTPPRSNTIDPRSGLVSSQAVRSSAEGSRMPPRASGALPSTADSERETTADSERAFLAPSRAQTDSFQMKRMR